MCFYERLRECVSSGEDVSVNTVIIQRNWRAILADLRSEATEEASIAPQFWGMMTVFTDTSDPELMYSHCYNVNTTHFLDLWLLHMGRFAPEVSQNCPSIPLNDDSIYRYILLRTNAFPHCYHVNFLTVLSTPPRIFQYVGGYIVLKSF